MSQAGNVITGEMVEELIHSGTDICSVLFLVTKVYEVEVDINSLTLISCN